MAWIQNGNKDSPIELAEDVLQIVVLGERRCGKTSFIRAYYDYHLPADIYSDNGARVYPCTYWLDGKLHKVAIIEISGDPDFFIEQRTPHYENADYIIFMYAIDDPLSHQMLSEKWIPEVSYIISEHSLDVAVVGTKSDLRNNQQELQPLTLPNSPGFSTFMICSAHNPLEINVIFDRIFQVLNLK